MVFKCATYFFLYVGFDKILLTIGYVEGVAALEWEEFGDGNYTVEYTNDLTSGSWDPIPGEAWPITATNWTGNIDAIFGEGVYHRVVSE